MADDAIIEEVQAVDDHVGELEEETDQLLSEVIDGVRVCQENTLKSATENQAALVALLSRLQESISTLEASATAKLEALTVLMTAVQERVTPVPVETPSTDSMPLNPPQPEVVEVINAEEVVIPPEAPPAPEPAKRKRRII